MLVTLVIYMCLMIFPYVFNAETAGFIQACGLAITMTLPILLYIYFFPSTDDCFDKFNRSKQVKNKTQVLSIFQMTLRDEDDDGSVKVAQMKGLDDSAEVQDPL